MKSRKSSLHDRLNIPKPKITATKSQSAISTTNKSLTNVFLKKNLAAFQNYSNLFGQKAAFHIGDADIFFKKSLRKYNNFDLKNTSWIKIKEPLQPSHPAHRLNVEHEKASGDSLFHEKENKSYSLKNKKSNRSPSPIESPFHTASSPDSRSESRSESSKSRSSAASSRAASSRPASSRPASSRPASSRPASSRPASFRPASSQPASSRAASKEELFRPSSRADSSRPVSSRADLSRPQSSILESSFLESPRLASFLLESPRLETFHQEFIKQESSYIESPSFESPRVESNQLQFTQLESEVSMAEEADVDAVVDEMEKVIEAEEDAGGNASEAASETAATEHEPSEISNDEDFKKMLDKSLDELKTAVEQLDAEALDEITVKVHDKIEELESDSKIAKPGDAGDSKAIVPFGKDVLVELEKAEMQAKSTANIINGLKERVAALLSKDHMTEVEAKELEEMNRELVKHMEDFEAKTKLIQTLVNFADQHMKPMKKLPRPQIREPEDMLPKVIICGTTDNNMPKIIICDADKSKKKRPRSSKSAAAALAPEAAVVPKIAKRLSDSYDMQEKLAADNINLEDKRFQLQEELLNKDKTCDNLQRKVCSLQTEVRLLSKENTVLNEKLAKVQGKCRPKPDLPCGGSRGVCPADVENRLQHYSQTTTALEKQVDVMEGEVRKMQEELCIVQRERAELEAQRKAAAAQPPPQPPQPQHVCRPTCHGPCRPGAAVEQQLRELREQYNRLQDDYKNKVTEVASLRADNEKLRCTCKDMDKSKKSAESKSDEMSRQLKRQEEEQKKLIGSREQLIEQEQQLIVAKQRFREAQDELEEVRALIGDQASQLEDYRNKYLQAQQQVEEQRRQIDMMEMENNRVSEQVAVEIQRVKNQFQEKLAELSPLPDILKGTQLKLQEEQQLRMMAERNSEALSRELQLAKEKEQTMTSQIEKVRSDQIMNDDEKANLQSKIEGWECKCNEMQEDCDKLKTELARTEETANQNSKRLDEKLHEIAQLTAQLETVREESARQVARTKDRCETVRRSMQGQIADLERQLAQARAMARSAQKDRDELRIKMQAQINNLNENFEEAQLRIRSLQGHVNFLKTSYTNVFGGPEPAGPNEEGCDCGNYT